MQCYKGSAIEDTETGFTDCIRLLLAARVDVNAKHQGHTLLGCSVYDDRLVKRAYPDMVDGDLWAVLEAARHPTYGNEDVLRHILERQLAVRAEDSDDDDDTDRTYAFPPPVDLDAYAAACRLPPAEETEDEREARFQRERYYGL